MSARYCEFYALTLHCRICNQAEIRVRIPLVRSAKQLPAAENILEPVIVSAKAKQSLFAYSANFNRLTMFRIN